MEQIRSFIAIELPDGIRQGLAQVEGGLKSQAPAGVRWVKPEGIHLTLKFLGNIAADRAGEITAAIAGAAQNISPFRLDISDGGAFPNLTRVQVVWVGIKGEVAELSHLQRRIEANLERLGFGAEARQFTPHLTLARLDRDVPPAERRRFGQLIAATGFKIGELVVSEVSLMRSQLTRVGAIYSRLSLTRLKE